MIGQFFAYLPWSADVALTCMVFYHVGYCIKVYNVLPKLTKNLPCIIALFILWIISIHNGGLELATRRFPYFPICMIGAIAGCLLLILENSAAIGRPELGSASCKRTSRAAAQRRGEC